MVIVLWECCIVADQSILFLVYVQVEQCRMPGLAIYLTLDAGKANAGGMGGSSLCGGEGGDVVSYVTGLLLSPNQPQRSWFAQFVKSGQRVSSDLQLFLQLIQTLL